MSKIRTSNHRFADTRAECCAIPHMVTVVRHGDEPRYECDTCGETHARLP